MELRFRLVICCGWSCCMHAWTPKRAEPRAAKTQALLPSRQLQGLAHAWLQKGMPWDSASHQVGRMVGLVDVVELEHLAWTSRMQHSRHDDSDQGACFKSVS